MAEWFTGTVTPQAADLGADLVPVSLAELGLPFLDEPEPPAKGIYRQEHTRRWSDLVRSASGFVIVTPEYNYGMPATLKNALDFLGREWAWKPVGFVSYGNTSAGTRAVQHAKQVVTTLRMVPIGATVALRLGEVATGDAVTPSASHGAAAASVLEELVRAAHALRPMRERSAPGAIAGPVPGSYLRRLTAGDAAEVTVLQRCCWVEEARANQTLDLAALDESPHQVREWLQTWTAWGLWRDGRLLGMVRTLKDGEDWHIGRLAVVPDMRARGIGASLLSHAEACAEAGTARSVLTTGSGSEHNLRLYQRQGYHRLPDGRHPGTVRLTKPLGSPASHRMAGAAMS